MNELINRIKISCGYDSDAAIARAIGMSPQNFFERKKSGGIKEKLILHAIDKGINKEWLITGKGEMYARAHAAGPPASYKNDDQSGMPLRDVIKMQADTIHEMQKTINKLQDKDTDLHKEIEALHKRIHDLAGEIGEIKTNMYQAAKSGDINRLWIGPLPDTKIPN